MPIDKFADYVDILILAITRNNLFKYLVLWN